MATLAPGSSTEPPQETSTIAQPPLNASGDGGGEAVILDTPLSPAEMEMYTQNQTIFWLVQPSSPPVVVIPE
jgi:hypothetical protein